MIIITPYTLITFVFIVNTIGTVDDLIEKYQSILTKIEEIVHLLFLNLKPCNQELSDIAEIKYGKGLEASKLTQNKRYPVYGSNGIIGTLETYDFDKSKIAISCRGASSGTVFLTKPFSTISSNSLYLNLKNDYCLLPIYSYLNRIGLSSFATGSAQPQITIENIQHLKVPDFQNHLVDYSQIINLIFDVQHKIDLVKKIKTFLLYKYF